MEDELVLALKAFWKSIRGDPISPAFSAKVRKRTVSYADVLKYAQRAGLHITDILKAYPNGIPPDVLDGLLRDGCGAVLEHAAQAQEVINRSAGIRLNPVNVQIDADRVRGLAEHIRETGVLDETKNLISNLLESHADDAARENAEFQDGSGMEVTVTRIYDDVGVNHGKDVCQWCLDRCGEDVPYKEAYDMGMFERHPGCGCIIEYHTSKGTQRQADWTRNAWKDSPDTLERRKTIGL